MTESGKVVGAEVKRTRTVMVKALERRSVVRMRVPRFPVAWQ